MAQFTAIIHAGAQLYGPASLPGSNGLIATFNTDGTFTAWVAAASGDLVDDTTPQLGGMLDVNGQSIGDGTRELLTFVEDALAVNHIEIENEATGSGPIIRAVGDDVNVDLNLESKGDGDIIFGGWYYDTANDRLSPVTSTGTLYASATLNLQSGQQTYVKRGSTSLKVYQGGASVQASKEIGFHHSDVHSSGTSDTVITRAAAGFLGMDPVIVTANNITDVPVTINLAVGHTANAFEVKNSSSVDLVSISTNGRFDVYDGGSGEARFSVIENGAIATTEFNTGGWATHKTRVTLHGGHTKLEHAAGSTAFQIKTAALEVWDTSGTSKFFQSDGTTPSELQFGTLTTSATLNDATGNEIANTIAYTTNKLTSGDDTGLLISKTDTASPGTSLALDIQTDAASVLTVRDDGHLITQSCALGSGNVGGYFQTTNWSQAAVIVRDGGGNQQIGLGTHLRLTNDAKVVFCSDGALNTPDEFINRNASGGIDFGKDLSTVVMNVAQDGTGIQVTASAITDVVATFTGTVGQTADLIVANDGTNDVLLVSPTGLMTVGDGTDADLSILQVNVTGTPELQWDESADRFQFSKGAHFGGNLYFERSDGQTWYGFEASGGDVIHRVNNTNAAEMGNDKLILCRDSVLGWSNTNLDATTAVDSAFSRVSANVGAFGNGAAADKTGELRFATGEIQAIHQATEVTSLPTGTTQTVTLDDNNHQTLDLTSTTGDTTVTLTVPSGSASGTLIVEQHATTARDITWALSSGTLKWLGTEPTWNADSTSDVRIVTWRWDGAIMYLAATDVAA